jgi:DNA-binding GntR family transcriptional regulator
MKYVDNDNFGSYKDQMNSVTQKITRGRLSSQVYDIVKDMIAAHRFDPGARINVELITKEIGVSRTPVWEAIHRLMQEGLLENIPNRGVFMATLTPQKALELYTVRESLESLVGQLAVVNVTPRIVKELEKMLGEQQRAIRNEDLVSYSQLDFAFHSLIYELSGNSTLVEMLGSIKSKMGPLALKLAPILSRLYDDHVKIVEALKTKDERRAEKIFRHHNRMMIEQIRRSMNGDAWKEIVPKKLPTAVTENKRRVRKGMGGAVL